MLGALPIRDEHNDMVDLDDTPSQTLVQIEKTYEASRYAKGTEKDAKEDVENAEEVLGKGGDGREV
jgi:hypothetical protein